MRIQMIFIVFTAVALSGGCLSLAEPVSLENGAITFDVPKGFTALSPEEIKLKYPSIHAPRFVVGNQTRSVSVAYDLKETQMPVDRLVDADLPTVQQGVSMSFERLIPGLQWVKREIVQINGKKCMMFEMTSNAIDQDIHNLMLMTFFKGKLFIVNFNSTKSAFPSNEAELKRCIQTIAIKE